MRVLHINSGNELGGGMVHILTLLKNLQLNIDVTLGIFENGELLERAQKSGIPTHHFHQKSRFDVTVLREIKKFVGSNNIDIVHTHGARANFYVSLMKKKLGCPWIVTVHSNPLDDFMHMKILGKLYSQLNIHAIRSADHVIAISGRIKDVLVELGVNPDKIDVILNGIDFDAVPQKRYTRKDFHLEEDDFVIMMAARLEVVKNHAMALEAVAMVLRNYPKVRLLLVGDGSRKEELKEMVKKMGMDDAVRFLGWRNDVAELLPICDLSLLTSVSESFPLVLLESARAKKPFISTDVGDVEKLAGDGEFSKVVPVNDVHSLTEQILEMIRMKEKGELEKMGERLRSFAKDHYSDKIFCKKVMEVYRSLVPSIRREM
jgi:Glycosyl transferases group 1.